MIAHRIGARRCSCCGQAWDRGCIRGPTCDCTWGKNCQTCWRCINHCVCTPKVVKCSTCKGEGYTGWTFPVVNGMFVIGGKAPELVKCEDCKGKGYTKP